jgi:branched-chain amino acid aminotransferase
VQFAKEHINRLFQAAKAIFMDLGITKTGLLTLVHDTLDANDMNDEPHVHIRLVVSRGVKSTPYQNPNVNIGLPLIVIIPEIKAVSPPCPQLIDSQWRRMLSFYPAWRGVYGELP